MAGAEGDGAAFAPPAVGSRVSTLLGTGKWGAAVVEPAEGAHAHLPFRLRYETAGSIDWVRFVSSNVLEVWHVPKARGRQGPGQGPAARAPPPNAATEVRPYFVMPEEAKTKGRPCEKVVRLREAAEAAAEEYEQQQQQQQQQQQDGGGGSPAKRRRLGSGSAAAKLQAAGAAAGRGTLEPSDGKSRAANGMLSPGMRQRPQQASPVAAEASEAAVAADAAEQAPASLQQPGQGLLQQSTAAGSAGDIDAPLPAAAAAAAAALGASLLPKRTAVTQLGGTSFVALATVPVDEPPDSPPGSAWRDKRRPAAPGSKRASGGQGEHSHSSHKRHKQQQQHRRHEREQPASRNAEQVAAGQQAPGEGAVEPAEQEEEEAPAPEPAPERPGDVACRQFAQMLPGLTLFRDSINVTAAAAITAGQLGACKEVVRCVLEHMRQEAAPSRRITFFYLLDAVLGHSRRDLPGCGPESVVGTLFPRTVGAALSQLVELLGSSLDGAQKMERTLTRTWLPPVKRGVEASLVQRSLEMLRDRIAQHEAAWGSGDTLDDGGNGGGARAAGGPLAGMPEGHQGGGADGGGSSGAGAPPGRQRLLDEAWLRQLVRKTPLAAAPIITFVNLKDGSRVRLTHTWQPPAWPDYDALPLPPGAAQHQYSHQVAVGTAAAAAAQAAGARPEDASPWHATLASWAGAEGWPAHPQQQQLVALGQQHQEHLAAVHAAQLAAAQQARRLMLQQQQARGQSTAAAAEADEFDAGLFKEAAGGVGASAVDHQQHQPAALLLPGMLHPFGDVAPWGAPQAPPLPDQPPPPPDDSWGGYGSEEDDFGPPPLPPHSPPRDEYEIDVEGESPPPLPPSEDEQDCAAPPPLPPRGSSPASAPRSGAQQAAPGAALTPPAATGYQGGWGGYGTPVDYAAGAPPQAAACQAQPGWAGAMGGMPAPHPLLPPGIGIAPVGASPAAAIAQQQAAAARQQMWMAQQQAQQAAARQAFLMRAAATQQQQVAMMGGVTPPGAIGAIQQQQQQLYSPAVTPGINMHMARQQQQLQQGAAASGVPPVLRPPTLRPPG